MQIIAAATALYASTLYSNRMAVVRNKNEIMTTRHHRCHRFVNGIQAPPSTHTNNLSLAGYMAYNSSAARMELKERLRKQRRGPWRWDWLWWFSWFWW